MASRAIVPSQPRVEVEGKQKNGGQGGGERRNRRALGDIGNLVPAVVAPTQGKPPQPLPNISRPITRSFCAQLLANAQQNNEKQPISEVAAVAKPGPAAIKIAPAVVAVPRKKETQKQLKPKTGIVTNPPDNNEKAKSKAVYDERKSRVGSSTRNKTLTSALTARSKAAGGFAMKLNDPVVNIDEADAENELAVTEYVEDMYDFFKLTEEENRVHGYMDSQPDINSKMRSILVDWLIEVHRKFELMPESLYLTINLLDRYLSVKTVPRRELQLVGIGAMLIACKYEEIWAPEVNDFIHISDSAYGREQILVMEKAILGKLEWYLTVPTPYVFLVRFIKAASLPSSDQEMESMVFFLAELGLMNYSTVTMYSPSMLAASAVYAAKCTLNKSPLWTQTLKHHTGYSEDQIMDCAKMLVTFHTEIGESKLKAVHKKFSSPDRGSVALYPPAKGLLL